MHVHTGKNTNQKEKTIKNLKIKDTKNLKYQITGNNHSHHKNIGKHVHIKNKIGNKNFIVKVI
jgi:hypothetical protein